MSSPEETNSGPVIRDHRRIDPVTGQVRDPGRTGQAQQAGAPRGPATAARGSAAGKPRPGRHAASKPGGTPGLEGTAAGGEPAPSPAAGAAPGQRAEEAGRGEGAGDDRPGAGPPAR